MESGESSSESERKVAPKTRPRLPSSDNLLPGRLIQVYPTSIVKAEKKYPQIHSKSPKFVPYEPYPAAVKPMTPKTVPKGVRKSKNNMDINTLISQMSQMDTNLSEFKPRPKLTSEKSITESEVTDAHTEEMQKKIDDLCKENESLKDQLKQQVQVFVDYSI